MEGENDSMDLGLVDAQDDTLLPDTPAESTGTRRRPPSLNLRALRHSSSFSSPSSPGLLDDLKRTKLVRSPTSLTRSQTLPRLHLKSPAHEEPSVLTDAPTLNQDTIQKLSRWICCFVLVNFDLDFGPVVYGIYPPVELSPDERENIAFSAFPDSARFKEGSTLHSFRIRSSWSILSDIKKHQTPLTDCDFLYGYSYFSRRKDSTSARGYDQRSIVILTSFPWPALFSDLVSRLGPMYSNHGGPMLESACHNMASWSAPSPGANLELGFLGSVLLVELPSSIEQAQQINTSPLHEKFGAEKYILASATPSMPPTFNLLQNVLTHLWSIWECLVLCEPLFIFGSTPTATSQVVWWLMDILRPIPTANDFRPYFTIHDKDYTAIINRRTPKAGLLIGVTNPLFQSLCSHWPHQLSLAQDKDMASGLLNAGPSPGWRTKTHNRYISKDKELLKQLEDIRDNDTDGKATLMLRQHFIARSAQFLVPLNRYLNTLIPSPEQRNASPMLSSPRPPGLKPFNQDHFMASLKTHGSPLPFRSSARRKDFYERWLRSPSFGLWMAKQEETVNAFLRNDNK